MFDKLLTGKVSLITGASRGIGLALAGTLGRMGSKLALCARDSNRLFRAAMELERSGFPVLAVPADVTRSDELALLVEKVEASLGPIDILINNAGIGYFAPVQDTTEANWDAVLGTNLKGAFLLSRLVAPGMVLRRAGHIVNIASLAGKSAFAGGATYCASKWGLLGFTQSMAEDLRPFGIRVTAVCPGTVATEFSPHVGKAADKMLQPEDVAHAVEMILTESPQSFISEVVLRPTQKA
ncbi:MAG TPA: SDR family NAD(P)-dependent oxidoreductase [Candidatus Acidoferrales bacterium]|nr:SDR family NAD(P)-dependent oxidoreductase [Candidatus Acidoferrales bacterium]